MSDGDWDSVTRIGSNVRRGGGAGEARAKVIKGAGAINAAARFGNLTSEKRYGGANQTNNTDGQRMAKIDREDDVVKVTTVGKTIGDKIQEMRKKDINTFLAGRDEDMTRDQLAQACSVKVQVIADFENGTKKRSDGDFTKTIGLIERALNVNLQSKGDKFGQPKFPNRNKQAVQAVQAVQAEQAEQAE